MALTVEGIATAKVKPGKTGDRWLSEKGTERNAGRLLVRISRKGVRLFYYRYNLPGDKRVLIPLGPFSREPKAGALTLDEARIKAGEYRELYRNAETRDVRSYLAVKARAERETREAAARRLEAERAAALVAADALQRYTVRALTTIYVEHLGRSGKARSAKDAANIFKNHLDHHPIATQPARDVSARDVTALLRAVVEAGKGRTAGKLRSYLRAAYALAIKADLNPAAPSAFIGFALESNPVAPVKALSEFTRARSRTLTDAELSAYWTRIGNVPSEPVRTALQLAVLLGGQRPAQLVRLRRVDVDLAGGWITLYDPKGARQQARVHELPLTSEAHRILEVLVHRAEALESEWVFTTDGKSALYPDTLTSKVREIAAAMHRAHESREPFKLSDVRRTAETMLAGMGISRDIRAQIQSHGLGGVQQRHYDKHDYREEKRKALTAWARRMTRNPPSPKVVQFATGRRSKS